MSSEDVPPAVGDQQAARRRAPSGPRQDLPSLLGEEDVFMDEPPTNLVVRTSTTSGLGSRIVGGTVTSGGNGVANVSTGVILTVYLIDTQVHIDVRAVPHRGGR
jgi:hypothetical protein